MSGSLTPSTTTRRNAATKYPPEQNGKERRAGLITKADYLKMLPFTDTGWVNITNFAANYSAWPNHPPQYRRLVSGVVFLRGLVTKSVAMVAGEVMFTLPAGVRPGNPSAGSGIFYALGSSVGLQQTWVFDNGIVQAPSAIPGANWLSLAGITYYAEN